VGDDRHQHEHLAGGVRVLVAIAPRSYREAVALYIYQKRPLAEVLITPPGELEREVGRFRPHMVVCNETTDNVLGSVHSWVEILFEDSLSANVRVDQLTAPFIVAAPERGSHSERRTLARLLYLQPPTLDPSPRSELPWCGLRASSGDALSSRGLALYGVEIR
jgi:hypothetical protein